MRAGFWRTCRVCFRWCRISLLLLILAAACVLLWFNQVGLPSFLKESLLSNLKQRGIQVQFTRMRLRMTRGIVAENVQVGAVGDPDSPTLSIQEVQLLLDFGGLLHGRCQVQGLVLREGSLVLPINETNQPADTLQLTNIQTDLRFQDNDTVALDNFQADFKNARLALSGDVVHATAIQNWDLFQGRKTTGENHGRQQLQHLSEILGKIHLSGTPRLTLNVEGDGRDPKSFDVHLQVTAPSAQTPWFSAKDFQFTANLTALAGNPDGRVLPGIWSNAAPFHLSWSTRFNQLRSEKLSADSVSASGYWRAPELAVHHLSVSLGDGRLDASFHFNAASQWLTFTNSSAFDLAALAGLLTDSQRAQLARFSCSEPPALQVGGAMDLSTWLPADGRPAGRPLRIYLNGGLELAHATFDQYSVDALQTRFSYTNRVWQLPDLLVVQDDTRLQLAASGDEVTQRFQTHVSGRFDVNMIRPWLKSKTAQREVGRLTFNQPLALDLRIQGRLTDPASLGVDGSLALTNFSVRGGPVDMLTTGVSYTNLVFKFSHPHSTRMNGVQIMAADAVVLDLNQNIISFTNGFSTAEPQFVANSIGPKTGRTVEPYQFLTPPTARVNGYVSLRSSEGAQDLTEADLQVDILKGAPFRWQRFNTQRAEGTIHWLGGTLDLTNLTAEFYGGRADGGAHFDFRPQFGTDFSFAFNITNANLHRLVADLSASTNRLEGLVGGWLVCTSGNSTNWQVMNGYGNASLHDGLIWDAPMFGVLSPALNKIVPGMGSSRATDAAAKFAMTNGVIYSDNMEIHSTAMRLKYTGTVDLHENLNAHATAQILRDTPGLGQFLSLVTAPLSKLFEYKVTGTLGDPHMTPLYDLSKLLLAPFHPIKTLEDILPAGNTNSIPANNIPPVK